MIFSRRYLTFIELMIVLAIIGSVAGVIGMNIGKAMQQQRFNTEVSFVVEQLRLAQNLMLVLDEDSTVVISKQPNGYYGLQMKLQCSLDSGWNNELIRGVKDLNSIAEITFENTDPKASSRNSAINIDFFSAGFVMSKGVLELKSKDGSSRYICLKGFPSPISAIEKSSSCNFTQSFEDDRITSITKDEISAKMQQNTQKKKQFQEKELEQETGLEDIKTDLDVQQKNAPKIPNAASTKNKG